MFPWGVCLSAASFGAGRSRESISRAVLGVLTHTSGWGDGRKTGKSVATMRPFPGAESYTEVAEDGDEFWTLPNIFPLSLWVCGFTGRG